MYIEGTAGDDNLAGSNTEADSIHGGAGNDILNGYDFPDTLWGDDGDDRLYGGTASDHLVGGLGNDFLDGGEHYDAAVYEWFGASGAITFTSALTPGGGEVTQADGMGGTDTLVGIESLEIFGGNGDDRLSGSDGIIDLIAGGGGNDTLAGGLGHDTFSFDFSAGSPGTDTVSDFGWQDRIQLRGFVNEGPLADGDGSGLARGRIEFGGYDAAAGTTRMFIGTDDTPGADVTVVLAGHVVTADFGGWGLSFDSRGRPVDTYIVYNGQPPAAPPPPPPPPPPDPAQQLQGTASADTLSGGSGDDVISGLAGNDKLYGGAGQDSVYGGAGKDRIEGGDGHDVLVGGDADDMLWGDEGADWIQGDAGADRLTGGGGNDFLVGGEGNDILVGNAGADTFFFGTGSGADRIDFFWVSHQDRVRIAAGVNGSNIATAADAYAALVDTADGALLDLGGGNTVLFTGVALAGLSPSIFEIV